MAYTTIDNPELYFQTKLYTGNGSTQSITLDGDENMQPDFVWIKNRDQTDEHCLFDTLRGATEVISSDATTAETTDADTLTSFDSDGFALGDDDKVNNNTVAYVAWNWKAGTTSGITTGGASITPTSYSFDQTAGFSIIKYVGNGVTGATLPHGLGVAPSFIIIKNISEDSRAWDIYSHRANSGVDPADYYYQFDTNGKLDDAGVWDDTLPTANLITFGSANRVNEDTKTMIAYCFTEVSGYSKFGYYTGNGDANGTFVYTGFRPAMVIGKASSRTDVWWMNDNKRDIDNPVDLRLMPNSDSAGSAEWDLDYLSNGFKIRDTDAQANGDGETYIYMAFAEAPFVNSNGVPCNAR